MDNLVTFFKLLFLLKTTLLTTSPITIGDEWISIIPSQPLEAITGGAAIYIDVTKYVKPMDFDAVSRTFPDGSVAGKLVQRNGSEVPLKSAGGSHSSDSVLLIVAGEASVPTGVEFVEVKLKSSVTIESANVYWKNGKH
jgi:hypothetical protein